jgi:hypothetical protein
VGKRSKRGRRERAPSLLTAPGDRIDLALGREYVLGRGRDCDIVVPDLLSSRHHARLAVGGAPDLVAITDLESRNGTFVDDARIESRTTLPHGARIRVGATVYVLSTAAAPAEDPLVETGTVALERLTLGPGLDEGVLRSVRGAGTAQGRFAGQLDSFGLVDVLQGLMQAGQSGTLNVALPRCRARVDVRRGAIVHASCDGHEGFDALVALAREKVGVFWLAETAEDCPRTIDEAPARLLYSLCRALDAG